jgi:hypothetical protein
MQQIRKYIETISPQLGQTLAQEIRGTGLCSRLGVLLYALTYATVGAGRGEELHLWLMTVLWPLLGK